MWTKLRLKNFQKHETLTVEFGPGVTTIVGPSDRGKSAVIRAIRWVAFNRPTGKAVVRHGEGEASALLVVDGHKVVRRRGARNVYALDGKTLVAFGSDVPDPVRLVLNVFPENLQRQFDPPFWLTLPPAELSRRMNAITGMDVIEGVRAKLAAKVRRLAAEGRVIDDEVKFLKRRLQAARQFGPLLAAKARADDAAEVHAKTAASLAQLEALAESLAECDRAKDGALALAGALAKRIDARRSLLRVRKAVTSLTEYRAVLSAPLPNLDAITAAFDKWKAARAASFAAFTERGNLEILRDDYLREDEEWRRLEKRRRRAERSLAVCPTCGSTLAGRPGTAPSPS